MSASPMPPSTARTSSTARFVAMAIAKKMEKLSSAASANRTVRWPGYA